MAWKWWQRNVEQSRAAELATSWVGWLNPITWPFAAYGAVRDFRKLFEVPLPAVSSPTYSLDRPRNLYGQDSPVPIVYGALQMGGLIAYQGSDGNELVDTFLLLGEGPLEKVYDLRLNGAPVNSLAGSRVQEYLGSASQNADARFASYRHQEAPGTEAWNLKNQTQTPALGTFTVTDDDARVFAKFLCLYSLNGPDGKWLEFTLDYRAAGAGSWTPAGTYRVTFHGGQHGPEEVRVPLWAGSASTTANVTLNHALDQQASPRAVGLAARAADPAYRLSADHRADSFAAGDYEVRLSYGNRWFDNDEADREIDGQLVLSALEIVEKGYPQAYRNTAYAAVTVPAAAVGHSEASLTASVAGRACEVWVGSGFVSRFTNNPVWIARDLWKATRYGAGRSAAASFADDAGKLAAAHCDEVVSTFEANRAVTNVWIDGCYLTGLADPERDYAGCLAVDNTGATYLVTRWEPNYTPGNHLLYVDRPWETYPPTSVSLKEQRFRCDVVFDERLDVGEALTRIAACCRGLWWEEGGVLHFEVERAKNRAAFQPGVDVVTPDLLLAGSFEAQRNPESKQPTGFLLRYRDRFDRWKKSAAFAGDGSGRIDEMEVWGTTHPGQAKRLVWYAYNASRRPWTCRFRTRLATLALEPGDRVGVAHPVTGWGYTMSDVSNPVRNAAADKEFLVVRVEDDAGERSYLLREYDAALYSDNPAIADPAPQQNTFGNPFDVPAPFSGVQATYLGDLTEDGIWNPEIRVGWSHPGSSAIHAAEVYVSLGDPDAYQLRATVPADQGAQVKLLGFTGSAFVKVIPVTTLGVRGTFAAASVVHVAVGGDVTPPAIPANLQVAFDSRLNVLWDAATESDFSHYRVTTDDWVHERRIVRHNLELVNPSERSFVVRVIAVDRSGNESGEASVFVYLPQPAKPDDGDLVAVRALNVVKLSVTPGRSPCLGHKGYLFRYSLDAGSNWTVLSGGALEAVTLTVRTEDFSGPTLAVLVGFCEQDILGESDWCDSVALTVYSPLVRTFRGSEAGPFTASGSTGASVACVVFEDVAVPAGARLALTGGVDIESNATAPYTSTFLGFSFWYEEVGNASNSGSLGGHHGNPVATDTPMRVTGAAVGDGLAEGTYDFTLRAVASRGGALTATNCVFELVLYP